MLQDRILTFKIHSGRIGRIYLYKYSADSDEIERLDVVETAAILDAKWYVEGQRCLLAAASALSEVILFELRSDDRLHLLDSIKLATDTAENLLTLAVDVRNGKSSERNLLASDSRGFVSLLTIADSRIVEERSWKAHSFEAWTCAFDKWNENVVYTGGDDTFFHVYDLRADEVQQIVKNKCHIAGVTSFLSYDESRLMTGSYDEHLRIFDTRNWREPLSELPLGGGIWRIKSSKCDPQYVLCACMYYNFSVCRIDESMSNSEVVAVLSAHESICYGADWAPRKGCDGKQVIATCSFYDKKMCVSTVCE